jgi:hypothetical protein
MKKKDSPIKLDNKTCPYCGKTIENNNLSIEHTIGRKFVPKGSLENEWNLLINACKTCNNYKSDLENDISAITQYYSMGENNNYNEVKHKMENSYSRRTKKKIIESVEKINMKNTLSTFTSMNFTLTMPPQIDENRIACLAKMYLSAFYYYLTYDVKLQSGEKLPDDFICFNIPYKSLWGDNIIQYYLNVTFTWQNEFKKTTADNNFKCIIKYSKLCGCYYWALEWNKSTILIGFFGNRCSIDMIINNHLNPYTGSANLLSHKELQQKEHNPSG